MGLAYIEGGGGGGVRSSDVSALRSNILAGTYDIAADSNDSVVEGTMLNRGAVDINLGINGTYTIPEGYHSGAGTVKQNVPVQGAQTHYAWLADYAISGNQWLSGAQTIKGLTVSGLGAGAILRGRTVVINNGYTDLFNVTGSNQILMYIESSAKGSATDRIGLSLRNNSTGDTLTRYFYYVDVVPGFTPVFVSMVSDGIVWRYNPTQFNYASASLTGQMDFLDPSQAPFTSSQCRIFFPTYNANASVNVWFTIFGY